jgi:tRNA (guanine-N7-)-methyltransferase
MKNPARSAAYFARMEERLIILRGKLASLISEKTPFVWEAGCGHGHFLTAYALANPSSTCIGIDIVRDRILRATRKRDRAKLDHLHFMLAEAHDFLDALPGRATLSAIFILFPDPWPKRRHHKNRLLQPAFFARLSKWVGESTRLYFRTDHEPYFKEVAATISGHTSWQLVDDSWPFELETVFQARALNYYSLVAAPRRRS